MPGAIKDLLILHGHMLQRSGARNLTALYIYIFFFLQGMSEVPELLVNVHKQSMEAGREERMEICSSVINQCSTAPSENRAIYTSPCSSD